VVVLNCESNFNLLAIYILFKGMKMNHFVRIKSFMCSRQPWTKKEMERRRGEASCHRIVGVKWCWQWIGRRLCEIEKTKKKVIWTIGCIRRLTMS